MNRLLVLLVFLLFNQAYAEPIHDAYQQGTVIGGAHANDALQSLKTLDVANLLGYQPLIPHPDDSSGRDDLAADGLKLVNRQEAASAIQQSFKERPYFQINTQSASMQHLDEVANQSQSILRGENSQSFSCAVKPSQCQTTWQQKTCVTAKGLKKLSCVKRLHLDLIPANTLSYRLILKAGSKKRQSPYRINLDFTQPTNCELDHLPCYRLEEGGQLSSPMQLPDDCAQLDVKLIDSKGMITVQRYATCSKPAMQLTVGQCQEAPCRVPAFYSATVTLTPYRQQEHWDNPCADVERQQQQGFCRLVKTVCRDAHTTHLINGMPFTRPCWQQQAMYQCGEAADHHCDTLEAQGCEQTASVCLKSEANHCQTYQQTYQCPVNQCQTKELICGDKQFCLEGECSQSDLPPADAQTFKQAIAALSALSTAATDMDSQSRLLFNGEKLECSETLAGVKNCCRHSGWGLDLNLAHCTEEEKKLGHAKESGLAIPTGKYCANRQSWPGGSVCVDVHQTYCVFASKLVRIMQEQGRLKQLNMPFGLGKSTDCRGLTPEQLQRINFSLIDFNAFFGDLHNRLQVPQVAQTAAKMTARVQQFYQQGVADG